MHEKLGIAGSGAIASGLAKVASEHGEVVLWARSAASAGRARERLEATDASVETDPDALSEATFVVEAIAEDLTAKSELLGRLNGLLEPDAVLATTTSSLSIAELARASGRPERFAGFHVFNPVHRMKLVELAFPREASADTRDRATALCSAIGKTAVPVPDLPGFVVNRLLFPYLFDAVRLLESTDMRPAQIDDCMTLGAGHPLGPLALLDLVGLDVAAAIGGEIGADVPARVLTMREEGRLGRKSGHGFFSYD